MTFLCGVADKNWMHYEFLDEYVGDFSPAAYGENYST